MHNNTIDFHYLEDVRTQEDVKNSNIKKITNIPKVKPLTG